ncbi:16S rRNA (guanine(966)-N(2))-methyltransferase RsmD [Coxiella endosymbiont of Amblyomma americanum]|uniref:16S rRNA (guanine(966)-N(2))-methyltransferase RsmD n=1 Tax=Coxiella endosymbiont of Amblyomma americanum TaxID=325775 RepID=UPI00057D0C34|nr:16S rRNA (guanine(966)-N(2))-methyltransferase RsmD [Coxiella endosymbiont of Amblyomma americanum]AJC50149.1 16S rRNA methyltransferase [Coxiella endosymbiont of Amblyomma americanum]AUJ58509.1 16S rRNA (guanine(966)-N(2))-methyltransferase RsmD [Coxiella-like endosymbiont of Amblyomma americanum]
MVQYLQGKVRITGGKWKGRKVTFFSLPGLRPTTNRIRETLFNWLLPYLKDSYCLDLFAGSGILGFEALSRGCAHNTFVDHSKIVIDTLKKNVEVLNTTNVAFVHGRFPYNIQKIRNSYFNIVFLDPPFYRGFINQVFPWLEKSNILTSRAYIYVEVEKNIPLLLPDNWESYRENKTHNLFYGLFFRYKK